MKIISVQNTIRQYQPSQSFKGKTINGHYYTDQEYVDAMKYKSYDRVDCTYFRDRYGFWQYYFTQAPEQHANEVNKCINDIKEEEKRKNAIREEKSRAIEKAKQELSKKIEDIEKKENDRKKIIEKYTNLDKNTELLSCGLSQENIEQLSEELFHPYAESIADEAQYPNTPNGILIQGSDSARQEKVAKAIAGQIQQENTISNFQQVIFDGNIEKLQNDLQEIKTIANQKYSHKKELTVIYIPDFDKIALKPNKADYIPELNSFLKVYMLNCAKNGCILLATAKDESKIESPFLINNKRFGVVINLENED